MMKIEGSGSTSQRHGSPDPAPHENVMDPQHRFKELVPEFYQSGDFLSNSLGIDFGKRQAGVKVSIAVFRIHLIRMFLGLPNPDPLVIGMDPVSDPSIILLSSSKNIKKNLDSYCFVTSSGIFIFEK
jgi:hypothetical protein